MVHIGLTVLILGLSYYVTQSGAVPVEDSTSNLHILLKISSGNNSCNNASLFSNFDWEKVPVFDALCNIQAPSIQEAHGVLLKYDVVPVLCMGFYEASLMLCKSALTPSLNEVFPPTPEKINNLVEKITKQNDYASLTQFCQSTVNNFTKDSIKDENSVAAPWQNILRDEFKVESKCNHICGITESDGVHPLCSFIVWSNNATSQPSLHIQKHEEMMPKVGDRDNVQVQPAAGESTTVALKANYSTAGLDTQGSAVLTSGGARKNAQAQEPPVNRETAVQVPQSLPDNTADRPATSGDVGKGKGSPQVSGDKKTDADAITKTDSSNATDQKVKAESNTDYENKEEPLNPDVGLENKQEQPMPEADKATSAKGSTADQPLPEVNSNMDTPLMGGDITGEAPIGQSNLPIAGDTDAEEGAVGGDEGDFQNQAKEDEEEANGETEDHVAVAGDKRKEPTNTNPDSAGKDEPIQIVLTENPHFIEPEDPHFFSYFLFMSVLTILAYLAFHNKNKLLALAVEGRRTKGTRRRPNSSNYSKLHCSLEEAMSSKSTASVTHVLY